MSVTAPTRVGTSADGTSSILGGLSSASPSAKAIVLFESAQWVRIEQAFQKRSAILAIFPSESNDLAINRLSSMTSMARSRSQSTLAHHTAVSTCKAKD